VPFLFTKRHVVSGTGPSSMNRVVAFITAGRLPASSDARYETPSSVASCLFRCKSGWHECEFRILVTLTPE
jgi:hypothetical protein